MVKKHRKAFDRAAIHAGNRALEIDREAVAVEVEQILGRMSWAQKLNEIRGRQRTPIEGLYHAGGDAALGIPTFKMVDGPRGARAGHATAFPVAIARAATFDVELERRIGIAIGREVAAKGGNVLLAPTINLLRHPGWGRAQETYSEDPHLTGAMGAAFVSGAQHHVLACLKHFALNNLENTRFEMSAEIDARTLHEVYLPHFARCVIEAGAAMIMTAYNKVNGAYCGEHPELLTEILRKRWGFHGVIVSDWILGTRSTAPALNAGLDIEMPAPYRFTDEKIEAAVERGELAPETVDQRVREVLFQKLAWRDAIQNVPDPSVVECDAHVALAREAAEKSLVLLKNQGGVLPLRDAPGVRVAVVGDLSNTANLGDRGSSMVTPSAVTTPLDGIRALVRHADVVWFDSAADLSTLAGFDAVIVIAGLTYKDEGEFIPTAQAEAEGTQLARGGDRVSLRLPDRERDLIVRAACAAPKTIVVLEGGSAIEVHEWLEDVDALLMAWYPGREGGHAIAAGLFGEVDPSGRLPVSFPRSLDQVVPWDTTALHVCHELLHGYRYLDHHGHEPEFPFGFGLSYTTFAVSELVIERTTGGFCVSVSVTNAGRRSGATVVQLYVGCVGSSVPRPMRELKGFCRVALEAGERVELEFELADDDLRYFDATAKRWILEPSSYRFQVGFSSRELPLESVWRLDAAGVWVDE